MPTLLNTRLKDVADAANFTDLVADNFVILAGELGLREPTYVSGVPNAIVGPPTTGAHLLDEFWRDSLGSEFRCTVAGTPGTWIQIGGGGAAPNVQTGTSYTLLASDNGRVVTLDNGSLVTLTVPSGLLVGFTVSIIQLGIGQVQVVGSGATVRHASSHDLTRARYSRAELFSHATNDFIFSGDTAA